MMSIDPDENPVLCRRSKQMMSIVLNRPRVINSLSVDMIDQIQGFLNEARKDPQCRFVLFYGVGEKGFCAGGDVKELARLAGQKDYEWVDSFFDKEYALDLGIHRFEKAVVVVADGVTMGGGLGIAAGADIRIATERTRMAMPETRIGFFPDVGSTGWMFSRCPPGYPEYLGLTGYDMQGAECVRLGLANFLTQAANIPRIIETLEAQDTIPDADRDQTASYVADRLSMFKKTVDSENPGLDRFVKTYFAGQSDIRKILDTLNSCHEESERCEAVFSSIAERSPTALRVTLKLLRLNEGRPIADVFDAETRAARWMSRHPDYVEGIRARLVDRDDNPRWQPEALDDVDLSGFWL